MADKVKNFTNHHEYSCYAQIDTQYFSCDQPSYTKNENPRVFEFVSRTNGPLQWYLWFSLKLDFFVVEFRGHPSTPNLRVVRSTSFRNRMDKEVFSCREDFHYCPPNTIGSSNNPVDDHPPSLLWFHFTQMERFGLLKHYGTLEMHLTCVIHTYELVEEHLETIPTGIAELASDMSKHSTCEYDVKLRIANKDIEAHRYVLTNRSPVFFDMFQGDNTEGYEGVVAIEDIELGVAENMIHYLYNGLLPESVSRDSALDLLKASIKFQIKAMQLDIEDMLMASMEVENFFRCFAVAHEVNSPRLKEFCSHFLTLNYQKVVRRIRRDEGLVSELKRRPDLFEKIIEVSVNGM